MEVIVKSMAPNKAPGIDKIPIRIIKDCLQAISYPLTSIINTSLLTACFPNVWKIAEVKPIPKEGDHELANNNRPISLLPILSKVCERVAHNQLMEYLTSKGRLSTKQSGNKEKHSTETSVIQTTDMILSAIDKKHLTAVILLDMSKAFDSIDHNLLLVKLEDVGASPLALQWFRSYLTARSQVVTIGTASSERLHVTSGVPQGSILGPLLFSIYMNDLPSVPQHCSVQCYVDDTKLLLSFRLQDQLRIVAEINQDLTRIRNWCFDNQLLLNPDKTKLLVCGSKRGVAKARDFKLSFLGKQLIPVEAARDLGVILDTSLTFDHHVSATVASCMSRLGQINRVKHCFDNRTLIIIINALVFSKLFYCSSVWSSTSQSNIAKLQAVQNFACRIVSGSKKYDHVTPILRQLNWLPVKQHMYYRDSIMAFKCMNGLAPGYLSDQFVKRSSISTRKTRNSQLLNIPLFKTATGQRTFYYRMVSLWNTLPQNIKLSQSLAHFKTLMKKKLLMDSLIL